MANPIDTVNNFLNTSFGVPKPPTPAAVKTPIPVSSAQAYSNPAMSSMVPKPISTVGPKDSTKLVTNTIKPKVDAQNNLNTNTNIPYNPDGSLTDYGKANGYTDVTKKASGFQSTDPNGLNYRPTPTPPPTAEEDMANKIAHPGQENLYNTKTGAQEWVTPGTPGYSTQNPQTRTDVSDTATDSNGVQYKQFNDGTYGRFDESGNYSPASAAAFSAAKDAEGLDTKIKSIINGTFVLPANQQAQLNGLSSKYAALIAKQEVENANITGATTIAENMYGMGNNLIGKGVITKTVNDGIQKVKDLQDALASDLATMTSAFQKDDMAILKDAYDSYETNQQKIQSEIDKQVAYVQSQKDKQQTAIDNKNMSYAISQMAKYGDAGILPTDTPEEVDAKKQNSAIYKFEVNSKSGEINQDALNGMVQSYLSGGGVPSFGFGATARPMREAFWARVGGVQGDVGTGILNKAALKASTEALTNIQKIGSATDAAHIALNGAVDIATQEQSKLFKTGSPFLNKPLQWIQNELTGNKNYSTLNTALKSVAGEYAKIISGASASVSGVPQTLIDEYMNQLETSLSNGQLSGAMNIMQQDATQRAKSYHTQEDQIKNDITEMTNSATTTNSDNSGGLTWDNL